MVSKAARMIFDGTLTVASAAAALMAAGCACISIKEHYSGRAEFFLGLKPVFIESGSMEPAIRTGSIVIVEQIEYDDLFPGDVITFNSGNGCVTHRFKGIDEAAQNAGLKNFIITKGDANEIEDRERISPEMIIGRVIGK